MSVPPVLLFTDNTSPTPAPATIDPMRPAISASSVNMGMKSIFSKRAKNAVNDATPITVFTRNSVPNTLYEIASKRVFIIRTVKETGSPIP